LLDGTSSELAETPEPEDRSDSDAGAGHKITPLEAPTMQASGALLKREAF